MDKIYCHICQNLHDDSSGILCENCHNKTNEMAEKRGEKLESCFSCLLDFPDSDLIGRIDRNKYERFCKVCDNMFFSDRKTESDTF